MAAFQRYLAMGLGNPGSRYDQTPHNIGSESISLLATSLGVELNRRSNQSYWNLIRVSANAEGDSTGIEQTLVLYLAKPARYMNESGQCVHGLLESRNVKPSHLLVVLDHMDLPLGQLRFRPSGGSGGHNGMRSIIRHLGTQDFPRLCVGVGRPPGRMDPAAYVLRRFSQADITEFLEPLRVRVGEAVVYWLRHGMESAMNQFNSKS